jgi:RNA-directed DNA polymerase
LHEGKTKIVYCQDYRRESKSYPQKFDFLGFSFQPRPMRSKRQEGEMFLGYDCAISITSKKRILADIRATRFHRWSTGTIEDLARLLNPKLRGWVNYFGKYGKSELIRVFRVFHSRLVRWVMNRYKRFGRSKLKAYSFLQKMQSRGSVFYHWDCGFI